jgi:outer membrane protein assembly factor BamB
VITGSDQSPKGYVYAFEKATGRVRWKTAVGGLETDILRYGDTIIGGATGGKLVSLDLDTGNPRWEFTTETSLYGRYSTHTPALSGDTLYFGGPDGFVYALKAESGEAIWKQDLGSRVMTPIRSVGSHIFAGAFDRRVLRLDRASGKVTAAIDTEDFPHHSLVPAGESLLVLLGPSTLISLDVNLTDVEWSQKTPKGWSTFEPLVLDGVVLVGTEEDELSAHRLDDGIEVWNYWVGGVPRSLTVSDSVLYVGTLKGWVYAIEWAGPAQ